MRIGYVVPSLDDTTGWGRWANDFLKHIVARGVDPVLWAPPSSESHFRGLGRPFPATFILPELFDSLRSAAAFRGAGGALRLLGSRRHGLRLDAVHSLDAYPWCLYGHLIARAHGVPHLITCHGRYGYIPNRRLCDRLPYRHVLRSCARLITVSDAVRREILKYFKDVLPPVRTTVLWNAVDAESVEGNCQQVGRSAGQNSVAPTIISVTRFIRSKGIETAIEAFALVRQQIPDARYVIVGPGNNPGNNYYARLERIIRDRGIDGITIAGRLGKSALADQYRQAHLLLHTPITLPDDFEAYGLILLEAGVFGLPVVATQSGGHAEVISHGENGLLVPEGDAAAAAAAVVALLRDGARAHAMGQLNRRVALSRNWTWYCREQRRIYDHVYSGR